MTLDQIALPAGLTWEQTLLILGIFPPIPGYACKTYSFLFFFCYLLFSVNAR